MSRWRRWLARRPTGRARVKALAVLVVTGVAAVVLAALSHQAWPPVVLAILFAVPGVYLAWPADSGSAPETAAAGILARGRPAAEWDVRRLGVHAAISVAGVADAVPPEYVPRDVDGGESGVRAQVAAAAERGGFVLLVGGSSVGKTRSAAEAVAAVLPDWWLVRPGMPGEVAALAEAPARRMVVWLDELQHYLDGPDGLTAAVVRALVNPPRPAVVIGTLWPDLYARYTAMPAPGGEDPYARERQLLDLATVVRIGPAFTPGEQAQAWEAATRDARLKAALESAGYGLTQTLAAAPQLVARWHDAQTGHPYAWAVLTAALDAARLGARAPLSGDFLRAAAPGYLTSQQQAEAAGDWLERALDYATGTVLGAAAALAPAGADMGQVDGYTPADYLIQHATRERHAARVPTSTWDAALSHLHDPADTIRLAGSAERRLLYCYAIPLYRPLADVGHPFAADQLADLLAQRSGRDRPSRRLFPWPDADDQPAADPLAERRELEKLRRDVEELRARADANAAAERLAELLAQRGDLDGLRARADADDHYAADQLAVLLAQRGDLDEAKQILRARADIGDDGAAGWLAELLAERGDLDGLRAQADAGDRPAARRLAELLAELLAERGDLDELRAQADAGNVWAAERLAGLLAERGDLDELRAQADAGNGWAAERLAGLLAERGDLDGLRARVDAGDWPAAERLAGLLAERGDLDGLRARVDAGDRHAAEPLVALMARQGRDEEAERLRRFGLNPDGSIASA